MHPAIDVDDPPCHAPRAFDEPGNRVGDIVRLGGGDIEVLKVS